MTKLWLTSMASSTAHAMPFGPPRRMLRPLPTTQFTTKAQLKHWFRLFIEDREAAGAERILRTAVAAAYSMEDLVELLLAGGGPPLLFCVRPVSYLFTKSFLFV